MGRIPAKDTDKLGVGYNRPESAPEKNDAPAIWELVIEDMKARDALGTKKYGTPLQANNGRKPLVDAYQEALDLVVYLRQELAEREPPRQNETLNLEVLAEECAKVIQMVVQVGIDDCRPNRQALEQEIGHVQTLLDTGVIMESCRSAKAAEWSRC